jgi:uncharacterized damage-inducible protein DinB
MLAELETYAQFYEAFRQKTEEVLAGLPEEALNWRPLPPAESAAPETNSLASLAVHSAGAARYWVGAVVAGQTATRDREAEFRATADSTTAALAVVDEAVARVQAVLAGLSPEALEETVTFQGRTVTRRWLIVHILAHTAEHLGQMALTRQLWEARPQAYS